MDLWVVFMTLWFMLSMPVSLLIGALAAWDNERQDMRPDVAFDPFPQDLEFVPMLSMR